MVKQSNRRTREREENPFTSLSSHIQHLLSSDTKQNKVTAASVLFTYQKDLTGVLIYGNITVLKPFVWKLIQAPWLNKSLLTPLHWEVPRSRHLHGLKWLQQFKASVTYCTQHHGAQERGLFPGYTLF